MSEYAYVRVSTRDQNIDRQLAALEPYRLPEENIYCDYESGKDFDRPAYKKLIARLKPGDLLYVLSIDRLGRNYDEIQNQWRALDFSFSFNFLSKSRLFDSLLTAPVPCSFFGSRRKQMGENAKKCCLLTVFLMPDCK